MTAPNDWFLRCKNQDLKRDLLGPAIAMDRAPNPRKPEELRAGQGHDANRQGEPPFFGRPDAQSSKHALDDVDDARRHRCDSPAQATISEKLSFAFYYSNNGLIGLEHSSIVKMHMSAIAILKLCKPQLLQQPTKLGYRLHAFQPWQLL